MRVTSKGQITIPIDIRRRLGILPGSAVEFAIDGDAVRITKANCRDGRGADVVKALRGIGDIDMSTDEIMALTRGE
jgi:AbrB family looped-hinge helix DNA binding protein